MFGMESAKPSSGGGAVTIFKRGQVPKKIEESIETGGRASDEESGKVNGAIRIRPAERLKINWLRRKRPIKKSSHPRQFIAIRLCLIAGRRAGSAGDMTESANQNEIKLNMV